MMHEAQMHEENSFITLTYSEENIPSDGNLKPRDFDLFMKRLVQHERYYAKKEKRKKRPIRYYHCGEYGEHYGRPHYHAAIFGYGFEGTATTGLPPQQGRNTTEAQH